MKSKPRPYDLLEFNAGLDFVVIHWVMTYGDYLKEAGYTARKLGLACENVCATPFPE